MAATDDDVAQMPFIKNLASSDRKLRTASLGSLQLYLSSTPSLPPAAAVKLWTGLFYALWMTDRPLPQQALANDLAALIFHVPTAAGALSWLRGFWAVVSRRWPDIDALRLDKFLLLVRRVFAAQVRWCGQRGWQGAEVEAVVRDVLGEWCFEAAGDLRRVPLGVRLHVLDLWVDELEREGALKDERAAGFVAQIGELVTALKSCPVRPARERAALTYADERLPWAEAAASGDEAEEAQGDDDEWGGIDD